MIGPLPAGCQPVADWDRPGELIPGYAISDDGAFFYWSSPEKKWKRARPKTGPGGFRRVRMVIRGRNREIGLAHIVLRAFTGPRPVGCEPLHFPDTDPGNNAAANLRWAPRGTSKMGRLLSGAPPTPARGSRNHLARLTEVDIPKIREMYRAGFRYAEIAADLGVADETVRHVLVGTTWAHVPDPDGPIVMRAGPDSDAAPRSKLHWGAVEEIRRQHAEGLSRGAIAQAHGISKCTVRDIIKGRTWRDRGSGG